MTRNVHICPVGFYSEPVTAVLGSGFASDRFYLLYNKHEKCIAALNKIHSIFESAGIIDIEDVEIDAFDYGNNLTTLMLIYNKEAVPADGEPDPDVHFFINFTSGTNITAGACCSAAYFMGATLYYVKDKGQFPELTKDELIQRIPIPRIPDMNKMKKTARDILSTIAENDGIGMEELAEAMSSSPQKINHHLNNFVEWGLVTKRREGRRVVMTATPQGRLFVSWFRRNED